MGWNAICITAPLNSELLKQSTVPVWALIVISDMVQDVNQLQQSQIVPVQLSSVPKGVIILFFGFPLIVSPRFPRIVSQGRI